MEPSYPVSDTWREYRARWEHDLQQLPIGGAILDLAYQVHLVRHDAVSQNQAYANMVRSLPGMEERIIQRINEKERQDLLVAATLKVKAAEERTRLFRDIMKGMSGVAFFAVCMFEIFHFVIGH